MATSTPTVPAVGGAKLASFDVTPAGPLDAVRALSPATGATVTPSDEPSPRTRFWEAGASAWTRAEGDAAFGSVAPSAKTAAGAEDTARGAGMLPRRVTDDREKPRVVGFEPESGPETSAARATTTAAAGDAAAFLDAAAEMSDAREAETRAAPCATARALDFDPRGGRNAPETRETRAEEKNDGERSARKAARAALLAFLARKAETLRSRRASRGAFAAWRGATRAEPTDTITETRTARLALRAWRLVARVGRARVEADALRSRLAEALAARAVADAGSLLARAPPRSGRPLSVSGARDSGDSGEASTSPSAETERPPYGVLDEKLARWLGVDAVSVPGAPRRASFAETTSFETVTDRPVGSRRGRDDENFFTKKTRLDAMEALTEAAREAEARASALETRAESLETDLYAAAVVWEETERENRLLTERVAAMREEAERLTAALAAAEADAADAARAKHSAARRDATAFRLEGESTAKHFDERRRTRVRDAVSRSSASAYGPRRFVVGDEVEELEACAAAMRRSTRRPECTGAEEQS